MKQKKVEEKIDFFAALDEVEKTSKLDVFCITSKGILKYMLSLIILPGNNLELIFDTEDLSEGD